METCANILNRPHTRQIQGVRLTYPYVPTVKTTIPHGAEEIIRIDSFDDNGQPISIRMHWSTARAIAKHIDDYVNFQDELWQAFRDGTYSEDMGLE